MSDLVVTTVAGGARSTRLWDGRSPLPLGHPFRWILEPTDRGARAVDLRSPFGQVLQRTEAGVELVLKANQTSAILGKGALRIEIRRALARDSWSFAPAAAPEHVDSSAAVEPSSEDKTFRRATIATLVSLALLSLALWLMPEPQEEELVPKQFTRIVMTKPAKSEPAGAAPKAAGAAAPKKADETAVIQAFRAKALRSSVSGLLKGGMTNLLAQSDFVTGRDAAAQAKRMFDSKSADLRATGQATGLMDTRDARVAALGGEAGPGGAGVGYGKGERAGVSGQGKAYVSMDTSGSSVEEGLTKDEVGEVIHRHMSEIRYCYESAIVRTPDIQGKLVMDFTIGGTGTVKEASVRQSTLPDPRLDACILRRLLTWKFPLPKGGVEVDVSYPFLFKTLGR